MQESNNNYYLDISPTDLMGGIAPMTIILNKWKDHMGAEPMLASKKLCKSIRASYHNNAKINLTEERLEKIKNAEGVELISSMFQESELGSISEKIVLAHKEGHFAIAITSIRRSAEEVLKEKKEAKSEESDWLSAETVQEMEEGSPTFEIFTHEVLYAANIPFKGKHPVESVWKELMEEHMEKKKKVAARPKIHLVESSSRGFVSRAESVAAWASIEAPREFYGESHDEFKTAIDSFIQSDTTSHGGNLVLVHGQAGTGKTSFLKNLIAEHSKEKDFYFFPKNFVEAIGDPKFTSYLRSLKGAVLIIEDADEILSQRQGGRHTAIQNLLNVTDGMLGDIINIKVIATFNCDYGSLDKALTRKGRLFYRQEFKELSESDAKKAFDKITENSKLDKKKLEKLKNSIDKPMPLCDIFGVMKDNHGKVEQKTSIGF